MFKIFFILLLFCSWAFSFTSILVTYPVEYFFLKKIVDKEVYIKIVSENRLSFLNLDKQNINILSKNHYYFNFDLDEERKLAKILKKDNSSIKTVNMVKGIQKLQLSNKKSNPYVWLDPILARDIAANIYKNMIKIIPSKKSTFEKNYKQLLLQLDDIYLDIKSRIDKSDLYGFFCFNNQLDYFAKRFRINIYHKKREILNPKEIKQLSSFSKKEYIKHILVSKNSDFEVPIAYRSYIDGKIVEYDILSKDWKVNLYEILRGIEHFN